MNKEVHNKRTKLTSVKRKGKKQTVQLRMSGRFLEENGFKKDETVDILVREDLLIIQPLKNIL
ncbi:MAG: type I toxin-antitoxin system SymE family toxin [Bacteroidetes bacterium]|nr:type I toxin-antitoxin system SymE family toxin [Bacteroidota bacterium]